MRLRFFAATALYIILFLSGTIVYSQDWVSPIDKKYSAEDPELFLKFSEARAIIDSYRGQRDLLDKAHFILQEILQSNNNYAPAYREYGRLFIMWGYKQHSVDPPNPSEVAILKSIEIEPNYADSYVLLGHLYTLMNRYSDAATALNKAENIGTGIPWLHLNWADLNYKTNDFDSALKRYKYVVDTGTTNKKAYSAALHGLSEVYYQKNLIDEALETHELIVSFEPESAWNWGNYASFQLFVSGDPDGSIENARTALQIMNFGMARQVLASALFTKWAILKNDPDTKKEAEDYFTEAISVYPDVEAIIEETEKFEFTQNTSIALNEWLNRQNSEAINKI